VSTEAVVSRLRKVRAQLPYLPRALALVWAAARAWTLAWLALLVVQGILPVAVVHLTRALVDSVVAAVGSGSSWAAVRTPLILALLMAGVLLLGELLRAATRWVRGAQADLVADHITSLVHDKAIVADLAFFESPEYHDQLHRARIDSHSRPVALVENLGGLLQNSITLFAMAAVLIPFGWWVPAALVLSTAPALGVVIRFAARQHEWMLRSTPRQRRAWYLDWLICSREAAPELRLFTLGRHFSEAYQQLRSGLRGERLALTRSEALTEMAAGAFGLVVMGACLAWMMLRVLDGAISLGALAMFYQAFDQGQKLLRSLLSTVGQLYSNILFLENLFEFLALGPRISSPAEPVEPPAERPPRVVFRDVTFAYPSSSTPVFEGFNLEIPPGQVVALLGVNGAGKSTLFKLLCRLYDPLQGQVEIGGVDLRTLRLEQARRLITVLFQEPVHYSETVRHNIELGDLGHDHEDSELARALDHTGARSFVERLPHGIDTLLGTWFAGGAELSVGEWQRLSLARAALRAAPVILLDEPTSAMDSWSETDWTRRLRSIAEGHTVILISHRLTTARVADMIHVMERGRIVESGTHDQLLAMRGRYAETWNAHLS
jgi:ATP-binding cassette subfamily B protein